jgi:protein SMG6
LPRGASTSSCASLRRELTLWHALLRSLITNNPFPASRESILPLFDTALQSRRHHPDASAADLFVLLQGMIFTRIELDAFDDVFARFFERLQEDRVGTRPLGPTEWVMMGVINLAACLQYGAEDGLLKRAGADDATGRRPTRREGGCGIGGTTAAAGDSSAPQAIMVHHSTGGKQRSSDPEGSDEGSDDSPPSSAIPAPEDGDVRPLQRPTVVVEDEESLPLPFRHALRLSFSVLSFCLAQPVRRDSLGRAVINPYITIFLTFLSTIAKQPAALALVERAVPWSALAAFFNTIPRKVDVRLDVAPKLTAGGPLPEDWCLRGMEWVGRRVYERGFWKIRPSTSSTSGGRSYAGGPSDGPRHSQAAVIACEMDVLSQQVEQLSVEQQLHEGIVDDSDGAEAAELTARRWRRIAWSLGMVVKSVPGFVLDPDGAGRKVLIASGGPLQLKLDGWAAERAKLVDELQARMRQHEAARDAVVDDLTDGSEDDDASDGEDEADPEVKELKVRLRRLAERRRRRRRQPCRTAADHPHAASRLLRLSAVSCAPSFVRAAVPPRPLLRSPASRLALRPAGTLPGQSVPPRRCRRPSRATLSSSSTPTLSSRASHCSSRSSRAPSGRRWSRYRSSPSSTACPSSRPR